MNGKSIRDFVLSYENIAYAIYTVKSYIQNPAMLSEDDKKLLFQLNDIYNEKLIISTIYIIKNILISILDKKDYYFQADVKFKPKKYDEDKGPVYRPIHTTDLISQIAIVSLLHALIYNFDDNKISLSELSQLIPNNFYGNKIAVNGYQLFKPWAKQYSEYNKKVNETIMEYRDTHEYKYMVTLDLKQFFPSVSHKVINKYLTDNIPVYYGDSDRKTITTIIDKLVHIKINNYALLNDYEKEVYTSLEDYPEQVKFCIGIPQGLPHSYVFANFIMISIADIYKKYFKGPMYFYVDDSSIFTNEIENNNFDEIIKKINLELEKYFKIQSCNYDKTITYKIEVHKNGKSFYEDIDKVKINFADLAREASKASFDMCSTFTDDEIKALYYRYNNLLEYVQIEISKIDQNNINNDIKYQIQHKKLTQYKKFFKYRVLKLEFILKSREKNIVNIDDIKSMLYIKDSDRTASNTNKEFEDIFQLCTDDILIAALNELQKNVKKEDENKLKELFTNIVNLLCNNQHNNQHNNQQIQQKSLTTAYELGVCVNDSKLDKYNYFQKIQLLNISNINDIKYNTLNNTIKTYFKEINNYVWSIKIDYIVNNILPLLDNNQFITSNIMSKLGMDIFLFYGKIIYSNNNVVTLNVLNALFSYFFNICTTDKFIFSKTDNRLLSYIELRILALVRNKKIRNNDLINKIKLIIQNDEIEAIDYLLLDVIERFKKYVSIPVYIDDLILIHKFCCDTWKNGSKYLNFYTMHNQEHAVSLINISTNLTKKISRLQLKQNEYFILFSSCYLHDISMVTVPDLLEILSDKKSVESILTNYYKHNHIDKRAIIKLIRHNFYSRNRKDIINRAITRINTVSKRQRALKHIVYKTIPRNSKEIANDFIKIHNNIYDIIATYVRSNHHIKSAEEICKHKELVFLDDSLRHLIAKSSVAHGYDAEIIYGIDLNEKKSCKISKIISEEKEFLKFDEQKIQIMLRLADLLDINRYRVSRVVFNHNLDKFDDNTKFHWISHLLTENCNIDVSYEHDNVQNISKENVEFNIDVNFNQKTPLSKILNKKCKYVTDTNITNNKLSYTIEKLKEGQRCTGQCNILCYWFALKNNYLFQDAAYLKEYLKHKQSIFDTNINIKLNYTGNVNVVDNEIISHLIAYLDDQLQK